MSLLSVFLRFPHTPDSMQFKGELAESAGSQRRSPVFFVSPSLWHRRFCFASVAGRVQETHESHTMLHRVLTISLGVGVHCNLLIMVSCLFCLFLSMVTKSVLFCRFVFVSHAYQIPCNTQVNMLKTNAASASLTSFPLLFSLVLTQHIKPTSFTVPLKVFLAMLTK